MTVLRFGVLSTLVWASIAAVLMLPPSRSEPIPLVDPLRQQRAIAVEGGRMREELLRRAHSRLVAEASVSQSPSKRGTLTVTRAPEVPEELRQRLQAIAMRDLADLPRRDTNIAIRVALVTDTAKTLLGAPVHNPSGQSFDVFPPRSVRDDACIVVLRIGSRPVAGARRLGNLMQLWPTAWTSNVLRQCEWFAAFGVPGRGMHAWLDSTHYAPIGSLGFRAQMRSFLVAPSDYEWSPGFRPVAINRDLPACASGHGAPCDAVAMQSAARRIAESGGSNILLTRGWIGSNRWWPAPNNTAATFLIVRMERELGADAFAKVWQSDLDIPAAFAAARGVAFDKWAQDEARALAGNYHTGPLPSAWVWFSYVLAVPTLLALGIHGVKKRGSFS